MSHRLHCRGIVSIFSSYRQKNYFNEKWQAHLRHVGQFPRYCVNKAPTVSNDEENYQKKLRNFCIIAHIDHGKSTLADRILEHTETVKKGKLQAQHLDSMELERERGITIKLRAVRMQPTSSGHILNLIDTPGHHDFSYEVSRSLAAVEGALLVVDASQGVEAQTVANCRSALENGLTIVPVLNKIDLPGADVERVMEQIEYGLNVDTSNVVLISAKKGIGIDDVINAIVKYIPAPAGLVKNKLKALIFDSYFDSYRGVVVMIRVVEGKLRKGDKIKLFSNLKEYVVENIGVFSPDETPAIDGLIAGEVGFLTAGIRAVGDAPVGDTITHTAVDRAAASPLSGYKKATPVVFCGMYPIDASDFEKLRTALGKLGLEDSSITYEPVNSGAMGHGFRIGFLGLLHMEIIQSRLEREYNLELICSSPNITYQRVHKDGSKDFISNPELFNNDCILEEPICDLNIYTPEEYVGTLMEFTKKRRGEFQNTEYLTDDRAHLRYKMPLAELVTDYHDMVKSKSRGFATIDFQVASYEPSDLVRLDIAVAGDVVDGLSNIVHRSKADSLARALVAKLKEIIPRHQFVVTIQAMIGNKIICGEKIQAYRKDVTAKCYGGDVSRKRKLLERQKEGKKRMKSVGKVDLPQSAFRAIAAIERE